MSNNAGNTLVALVGGIAIGAGIGILFAPAKGKTLERN
jgi:gas vesicle protein